MRDYRYKTNDGHPCFDGIDYWGPFYWYGQLRNRSRRKKGLWPFISPLSRHFSYIRRTRVSFIPLDKFPGPLTHLHANVSKKKGPFKPSITRRTHRYFEKSGVTQMSKPRPKGKM